MKFSLEQKKTINLIVKRANKMFNIGEYYILMDIIHCITGGCNLDLEELLNADDANFAHDICGIHNNLDSNSYELKNNFIPRYAIN